MKYGKAKKFGLFTAISLIVGSVVGIGIFFKNISIFSAAEGNGGVILSAWIISGFIALGAALAFAEIGTGVHGKAGLSNYAYKIIGKKFGKICKIVEPVFYHSILIFALSCFAGEAVLNVIIPFSTTTNLNSKVHMGYIVLTGILIWLFFWTLTIISSRIIGGIQNISVILKFIPLLLVAIIGLLGINGTHSGSVFTSNVFNDASKQAGTATKIGSFKIGTIIMVMPATLFAFDGFIHITNISTDIENPRRNVPLGIILGMLSVTGLYFLITLSQLLVGQSDPKPILENITNDKKVKGYIEPILNVFIASAALGVCNGFVISQVRSTEGAIESRLLIGSNKMMEKFPRMYGFVYSLIIFLSVSLIISIPSIIKNTDAIIDAISNIPVLLFFCLYNILIIAQVANRLKIKSIKIINKKIVIEKYASQKIPTKNISGWIFYPLAFLSVTGILICISYEIFCNSLYNVIHKPYELNAFGLFHATTNSQKLRHWEYAVLFTTTSALFICLPPIMYNFQKKHKF